MSDTKAAVNQLAALKEQFAEKNFDTQPGSSTSDAEAEQQDTDTALRQAQAAAVESNARGVDIDLVAIETTQDRTPERNTRATATTTDQPKATKPPTTRSTRKPTTSRLTSTYPLDADLRENLAQAANAHNCWQSEYVRAAVNEFADKVPVSKTKTRTRSRTPTNRTNVTFALNIDTKETLLRASKRTSRSQAETLRLILSRAIKTGFTPPAPTPEHNDEWD